MTRGIIRAPRRVLRWILGVLAAIVAAAFVFVLCQTPPESTPLPKDAADALAEKALPAGASLGEPVALLDQRGVVCGYVYPVVQDGQAAASISVSQQGGERFVSAAAAPPGGAQAEAALGRPLLPGDTAYAPGAVPFSFAVENGDGTFFVAFSETGSVRQIPAWNFWLACKAQCAEETFMR